MRSGDNRGVSMMVEYLILLGILSVFVAVAALSLEDTLRKSQVSKVVDNQFSDVASQISAQVVDMATLYPSNGYLRAKVYMPSSIGDIKYIVGFEERGGKRYIFISSDRGEFRKYLSLGAFANLKFENISGITHSLKEKHELLFTSASIIYPTAVLKVRPSAIISGSNVTIDVSESYSPVDWWWVVKSWNGSELASGDMSVTKKEIGIYWSSDIETLCKYNSSTESAVCELRLEVYDSRGFTADDTEEILIAKKVGVEPELYIKKFASPETIQVGQPFELHIRMVGRGFVVEETRQNLSVVTVVDKSGSMHAGNVNEAHEERTKFGEFMYSLNPNVVSVNVGVQKGKPVYIVVYTNQSMPFWSYSQTENLPSGISPDDAFTLYVNGQPAPKTTTRYSWRAPSYGGVNFECVNGELTQTNGICYETTPGTTETWNLSVVVSNPESIQLNILVFERESSRNYNYRLLLSNQTQYNPNYAIHNFKFDPGYTSNDRYEFAYVFIPKNYGEKVNAWIKNLNTGRFSFCRDYTDVGGKVCFVQNVPAGQNVSVYIVPSKIDASYVAGSLWMEKLDAAKIAAIKFIRESLNETDYKGLVDFSTCANTYEVNSSSPYLRNLTTDSNAVVDKIKNIVAGGWTNYIEALEHAKRVLTENVTLIKGTKPLVILLSDGMPTCRNVSSGSTYCSFGKYTCSDTACNPDDCGGEVIPKADELKNTKIGDEYIDICTIGFGEKSYYNETILRAVSGRHTSSGVVECYYPAETLDQLIDAFYSIGRIYKIAATNVSLVDTIPVNLSLYLYPEVQPELTVNGNANCSLNWTFVNGSTLVNVNCSEIYIDDEIELVLTLVTNEFGGGFVTVNEGGKITFTDINGQQRAIDLPMLRLELKEAKGAEVKIS